MAWIETAFNGANPFFASDLKNKVFNLSRVCSGAPTLGAMALFYPFKRAPQHLTCLISMPGLGHHVIIISGAQVPLANRSRKAPTLFMPCSMTNILSGVGKSKEYGYSGCLVGWLLAIFCFLVVDKNFPEYSPGLPFPANIVDQYLFMSYFE
ncbi:MAG: hypothetical protein HGB22_09135 [Chlorobiaceae bacterium]|nr:hypothetical protein [Chlorobiaceae bacterium]